MSAGPRGLPVVPGPERLLASRLQLRVLHLLLRDLLPALLLQRPDLAHHREAAEALPGLQGRGRAPQGTPNLSLLWPPAGQELEHSFMATIMRSPSYECWKVRGPVLCLKSQDHSRHRLGRDPLRGGGGHHHLLLPVLLLLPVPPAPASAEPVRRLISLG
uniref:protein shisa-4 isoform X5 n=1 Tax=Halichoerus grypus TaxID=9711 RepID=UPI001659B174|nr:protein shisa-4 isoform X5 [Halichoerus grypus]